MLAGEAYALKKEGNIGIAYTYNEPLIGWEFVRDTARLVQAKGMKNVMVTNGCATLKILDRLLPYIDAMNIDLKGFTKEYYDYVGGDFEMVKAFIKRAVEGCHVELTTLIVSGKNDTDEEMEELSAYVASLRRGIPLHVTRCFPRGSFTTPATPVDVVYHLADVAKKSLEYVFVGNC